MGKKISLATAIPLGVALGLTAIPASVNAETLGQAGGGVSFATMNEGANTEVSSELEGLVIEDQKFVKRDQHAQYSPASGGSYHYRHQIGFSFDNIGDQRRTDGGGDYEVTAELYDAHTGEATGIKMFTDSLQTSAPDSNGFGIHNGGGFLDEKTVNRNLTVAYNTAEVNMKLLGKTSGKSFTVGATDPKKMKNEDKIHIFEATYGSIDKKKIPEDGGSITIDMTLHNVSPTSTAMYDGGYFALVKDGKVLLHDDRPVIFGLDDPSLVEEVNLPSDFRVNDDGTTELKLKRTYTFSEDFLNHLKKSFGVDSLEGYQVVPMGHYVFDGFHPFGDGRAHTGNFLWEYFGFISSPAQEYIDLENERVRAMLEAGSYGEFVGPKADSDNPTPEPTEEPTEEPSPEPSEEPSEAETEEPEPTVEPSEDATEEPGDDSEEETPEPSAEPSESEAETEEPTVEPTEDVVEEPEPSTEPTEDVGPTEEPSEAETGEPEEEPTKDVTPTVEPTDEEGGTGEATVDQTVDAKPTGELAKTGAGVAGLALASLSALGLGAGGLAWRRVKKAE